MYTHDMTGEREFQSTPPARGATCTLRSPYRSCSNFNPRPPRGGRPLFQPDSPQQRRFQSTPPARGATPYTAPQPLRLRWISIHAPREGGDFLLTYGSAAICDFNPRPPRGGRRADKQANEGYNYDFNPRPPRGGRPLPDQREAAYAIISIHAPREGGDGRGGASSGGTYGSFQSTPPARGATPKWASGEQDNNDFNPRPPRGGRRRRQSRGHGGLYFNPRPPRGGRLGHSTAQRGER